MAELREVKLDKIKPNPFRDIENYPFWRDKLDRLKESMKSTGTWPNIIVREGGTSGEYELAFGHHRIKAMEELGIKKLSVIVEDLNNDAMLRMMCDENAEEFGTNFALGTMNAVDAVRKHLRVPGHTVTANEVGRYLGWTAKSSDAEGGEQAAQRVIVAWNALELVDLGVLKPNAFQDMGHKKAREIVVQAQMVYKARMRELEKEASEKEVKKAQAEAKKAAAVVAGKAVSAFRDGAGVREVKETTKAIREEIGAATPQRSKPADEIDASRMLEKAAVSLDAWLEANGAALNLYARGAICDGTVERHLLKAWRAVDRAIGTAREKRG